NLSGNVLKHYPNGISRLSQFDWYLILLQVPYQKPDCTFGCDRGAKMRGRSLPFTSPQTRRFSNSSQCG
ncbi:hypothetical protein, partial [Nostoc sp.]|uniref:hypothetical protein n=1 Tax=Nostoc sp. TaxID=1180 RepID=UPI002FF59336